MVITSLKATLCSKKKRKSVKMGTRDTHKLNIDQGHVWRRVSYDDYDDDVHQRKTITKTTTKIQGFLRCCCVKQG